MSSSTRRFETDPPCDFLAYLEWRLGKGEDATARLLGEWLTSYEPERRRARAWIRSLEYDSGE
jgi:hypothetical protein